MLQPSPGPSWDKFRTALDLEQSPKQSKHRLVPDQNPRICYNSYTQAVNRGFLLHSNRYVTAIIWKEEERLLLFNYVCLHWSKICSAHICLPWLTHSEVLGTPGFFRTNPETLACVLCYFELSQLQLLRIKKQISLSMHEHAVTQCHDWNCHLHV